VAVLDPAVPRFTVDPKDIRTEWYSGSGAGGQHRNKHQNSCRLTHVPTGIVATSQSRSRQNSYTEAYETLKQRLDEKYKSAYNSALAVDRKQQVGSGQRGDKIRTYRFQDDRVKDHETGKSASCSQVLRGHFDLLW
jgi:peptide chain release factor 1